MREELKTLQVSSYEELNLTTTVYKFEILHEDNSGCISNSLQILVNDKELTIENNPDVWKWFSEIHGKGRICVFITHFERTTDYCKREVVSRIPYHKTEHAISRRIKFDKHAINWVEERLEKCNDKECFSDYNKQDYTYDKKYDI